MRLRAIAFISVFFATPVFAANATPAPSPLPSASGAAPDDLGGQDPKSIRDPFKRGYEKQEVEVAKSELERHPVDTFRMTGVITGMKRRRAMVLCEDNKVYLVSEGMKIGVKNGVIVKILEDRIIVRESALDRLGEREFMTQEIPLLSETKLQLASPVPAIPADVFAMPTGSSVPAPAVAPLVAPPPPAPVPLPSQTPPPNVPIILSSPNPGMMPATNGAGP